MNKIFITGSPGTGKSTIIKKAVIYAMNMGVKVVGFFTPDVRDESNKRIGFDIDVIGYGKIPLARKNFFWDLTFGSYHINPEASVVFDITLREIESMRNRKGLVIIDELGPMELLLKNSEKFFLFIINQEEIPVLGVFHRRLSSINLRLYQLITKYTIYDLDRISREVVNQKIIEWINELR